MDERWVVANPEQIGWTTAMAAVGTRSPGFATLQCGDCEVPQVRADGLLQSVDDPLQGQVQGWLLDEASLEKAAEQLRGEVQLSFGILRVKLEFFEEIPDSVEKDVLRETKRSEVDGRRGAQRRALPSRVAQASLCNGP